MRDEGLAVRVLVGSYGGVTGTVTAALRSSSTGGVDGSAELAPLPSEHNGFIWVLDGTLAAGGATLPTASGAWPLPPGGDGSGEGAAEFFVATGAAAPRPALQVRRLRRRVGRRSVAGVEAAMSTSATRGPSAGRPRPPRPRPPNLVGGFQDDDGPMMERPAARSRGLCMPGQ